MAKWKIPQFISQQTQRVAATGALGFEERVLDIEIPQQRQDNWCWAAVTEGLERAYGIGAGRDQCSIASNFLGQTCCPPGTNVGVCNRPQTLEPVLGGIHRNTETRPRGREFAFVRARIRGGFPVVAFIDWGNGGAGHFVVISGYRRVGDVVDLYVCDPYTGLRSEERFEHFMTRFRDTGRWASSHETQGTRVRAES